MHAADVIIDVTAVDAVAMYPLGQLYSAPARSISNGAYEVPAADTGPRTWRYVELVSGTSFAIGDVVTRADGSPTYEDCALAPVDSPTIRTVGVLQHAADASVAAVFSWVLKEGVGEVLADTGGYTADTALVVGDAVAGRADDVAAVTDHAFAFATEAAAATALGTCMINCPG